MDIITLICRDGNIKACQEELTSSCDFFKTYISINMNDDKQKIFIPFTKDIVINFLNFINKNKESVDFSKLKYIRKYCGCKYDDNLDDYDYIAYNIERESPFTQKILKEMREAYIKNNIDINDKEKTTKFLLQYIKEGEDNIKYYYAYIHDHSYWKHSTPSEKFDKIILSTGKTFKFSGKVLELNSLLSEDIIEEFYKNNHNNQFLSYTKEIRNQLNNFNEIRQQIDRIINIFDKFDDTFDKYYYTSKEINDTLQNINNKTSEKLEGSKDSDNDNFY